MPILRSVFENIRVVLSTAAMSLKPDSDRDSITIYDGPTAKTTMSVLRPPDLLQSLLQQTGTYQWQVISKLVPSVISYVTYKTLHYCVKYSIGFSYYRLTTVSYVQTPAAFKASLTSCVASNTTFPYLVYSLSMITTDFVT